MLVSWIKCIKKIITHLNLNKTTDTTLIPSSECPEQVLGLAPALQLLDTSSIRMKMVILFCLVKKTRHKYDLKVP